MIVILKMKITWNGWSQPYLASESYAVDATEVVWIYENLDEASKGNLEFMNRLSKGPMEQRGYKKMRRGKNTEQYAIDLSFNGVKDNIYLIIEEKIRPMVRENRLNNILK